MLKFIIKERKNAIILFLSNGELVVGSIELLKLINLLISNKIIIYIFI